MGKPPAPTYSDQFALDRLAAEVRQAARLAVAARARSNDDCKELLDALGLIGDPDGMYG